MLLFTGFLALFVVPIWFALGLFTLGLLWPPQIRRWIFCPSPVGRTVLRKSGRSRLSGLNQDDLTKTKFSKLRTDLNALKAVTQDQNYRIQKDLSFIKEAILIAAMQDDA